MGLLLLAALGKPYVVGRPDSEEAYAGAILIAQAMLDLKIIRLALTKES